MAPVTHRRGTGARDGDGLHRGAGVSPAASPPPGVERTPRVDGSGPRPPRDHDVAVAGATPAVHGPPPIAPPAGGPAPADRTAGAVTAHAQTTRHLPGAGAAPRAGGQDEKGSET